MAKSKATVVVNLDPEAQAQWRAALEERDRLSIKLAIANETVTLLERQRNQARIAAKAWKRAAKMWRYPGRQSMNYGAARFFEGSDD